MKDESVLDPKIQGYDWEMAFQCCGPVESGDSSGYNSPSVSSVPGEECDASPFGRLDVARVVATSDGENDGANWIGIFRLKDGRFAFLSAGCDYTGWDCQSGGSALVSKSLDSLLRNVSSEEQDRLCLEAIFGKKRR